MESHERIYLLTFMRTSQDLFGKVVKCSLSEARNQNVLDYFLLLYEIMDTIFQTIIAYLSLCVVGSDGHFSF